MASLEGHENVDFDDEEWKLIEETFNDPVAFVRKIIGKQPHWYQELFLRDDTKDIVALWGRQMGKCSKKGTEVLNISTGALIPIESVSPDVIVAGLEGSNIDSGVILEKFDTGYQKCYAVTTNYGFEIETTIDHKFLTPTGFKSLKELSEGDHVAVIRSVPFYLGGWEKDEVIKLVAYMIADGSYVGPTSDFTNIDMFMLMDFISSVKELNFENTKIVVRTKSGTKTLRINITKRECEKVVGRNYQKRNSFNLWLRKIGLKDVKSAEKIIPSFIFKLNKKCISLFLNRLFACDGWYTDSKLHPEAGYSSNSKKLVQQVQHLLLRFGIISTIRKKMVGPTKQIEHYQLTMGSKDSLVLFIENIDIFTKERKGKNILKRIRYKITNSNTDIIPKELWLQLRDSKENTGKTWSELGFSREDRFKMRYRSRERFLRYAIKIGDEHLISMGRDILWQKITTIIDIGIHHTYDLATTLENYVANNFIVHNSQCIAWRCIYKAIVNPEVDILMIAPSQRQSQELYDKVYAEFRWNDLLSTMLDGKPLKSRISIANGSKIMPLPIGVDAAKIRGYSIFELIEEEAAFIPRKAHEAVEPFLAATDGSLVMIGTPMGKFNVFYESFESWWRKYTIDPYRFDFDNGVIPEPVEIIKPKSDRKSTDLYSVYHFPSILGLTVIRPDNTPQISIRAIHRAKNKGLMYYEQEYLALPGESEYAYFAPKDIDASIEAYEMQTYGDHDRSYYLGYDIGKQHNSSVIIVVEYYNNHLRVVYLKEWEGGSGVTIGSQLEHIVDLNDRFNIRMNWIDQISYGERPLEELQEKMIPVEGVKFSTLTHNKNDLYGNLTLLFHNKLLTIPKNQRFIYQLHSIRLEQLESGNIKIIPPPGEHDDYVDALALACICARREVAPIEFFAIKNTWDR